MFNPFSHELKALDEAIASAYSHLTTLKPDEDGYQKTIDQIVKLEKLHHDFATLHLQAQKDYAAHQLACSESQWEAELAERPWLKRLTPDTVLTVGGSLLTALFVIKYEQTGVISSKAMSFMRKF